MVQDKQHCAENQEIYSVYNRKQQYFMHIRAEDMRTLPIHRPPLPQCLPSTQAYTKTRAPAYIKETGKRVFH